MSKFTQAIGDRDADAARKALARSKDPERLLVDALDSAAGGSDQAAVEFILETFHPPIPASTMHLASIFGNVSMLRVLVEHGGDINAPSEEVGADRKTPIHGAASAGDASAIQALVECGADVNARDKYGRTPLMHLLISIHAIGVQQSMLELLRSFGGTIHGDQRPADPMAALRVLLQSGADASLTDYYGNDAVMHYESDMARSDAEPDPEVIAILAKFGAPGSRPTGRLFRAIEAGDIPAARNAIAEGADLDRVNPAPVGMTPLMAASQSTELVQVLLDAGADPNKPGLHGTPLISAAFGGSLMVVKQLIAAGADVEALEPDDSDISFRRNAYLAAELNRKHDVMDYLKSLGSGRPRARKPVRIEPGVGNWEDFSEFLIKTDVPTGAAALARMIGGRVHENAYGESFRPGKHAYVIARPRGLKWSNVFRISPPSMLYEDQGAVDRFAMQFAQESGAPVLYVLYNDTAGAAAVLRYESGASEAVEIQGDPDDSMENLESLAKTEKFVVAAFGAYCEPGRECDVEFTGYPAETFDGVAFVSD